MYYQIHQNYKDLKICHIDETCQSCLNITTVEPQNQPKSKLPKSLNCHYFQICKMYDQPAKLLVKTSVSNSFEKLNIIC